MKKHKITPRSCCLSAIMVLSSFLVFVCWPLVRSFTVLHKESKNGFKTISCRPYPVMIFSKNCFWCKKIIKKLNVLMIFELLWQCIWLNYTSLKKMQEAQNQFKYYQNVKNWSIFSYVTFYFWKSGVWDLL